MNKYIYIRIVLNVLIIIFGTTPVFASSPAPTPVCHIECTIKSVEFKDAYDEPCLSQPHSCPTDMELNHPARYFLNVDINSVSYISGTTDFNTCEKKYPVGSVQTIFIDKAKVKSNDTFTVNKKIEGVVRSFWGSSFDSYNLKGEVDINELTAKKPFIFSSLITTFITTLCIIFVILLLVGIINKIISSRKKLS